MNLKDIDNKKASIKRPKLYFQLRQDVVHKNLLRSMRRHISSLFSSFCSQDQLATLSIDQFDKIITKTYDIFFQGSDELRLDLKKGIIGIFASWIDSKLAKKSNLS